MAAEKYIHASYNIFYCIRVKGIRVLYSICVTGIKAHEFEADMAAEKYIHASHNILCSKCVTGIRARETEADVTAEKYIHTSYNILYVVYV